jgi:ribonuclease HII
MSRLSKTSKLKHFLKKNCLEVGVDEVARGCLVGRVYAAAVIWNPLVKDVWDVEVPNIRDSKKCSAEERQELRKFIEKYSIDWGIGWVDEKEVDKINIRNATFKAMHKALDQLIITPENILVDGNSFPSYPFRSDNPLPHTCIIKGDNKLISIAAASILAKTYRDDYINQLLEENPDYLKYKWDKNNGYSTKEHVDAIEKYGLTPYHRTTFGICKKYKNNTLLQ